MELLELAGPGALVDPFGYPAAGTCWPSAVRFTGAGADDAVRVVLSEDATKTPCPPALTALVFGARKGTYCSASGERVSKLEVKWRPERRTERACEDAGEVGERVISFVEVDICVAC